MWSDGGGPSWLWSETMVVDIDICWPTPFTTPIAVASAFTRSIPTPAIAAYLLLLVIPRTDWLRLIALGLVIHMLLDGVDCLWIRLE